MIFNPGLSTLEYFPNVRTNPWKPSGTILIPASIVTKKNTRNIIIYSICIYTKVI